MTIQRELATKLLESVADDLEVTFRTHRYCNTMLARYAGNAAQALELNELTVRFARLLKSRNGKRFFGGIITNARLPWFVPRRMRQLTPMPKFNEDHPVFTDDFATETFSKYYPEMLSCLDHGFDSLLNAATNELTIEEIALSQAILGQYDDALGTSQRLTESHRQNDVRFVVAIEQYRHDQLDDARAMQETLADGTLTGWGGAQFALGISNRVPWCPYPYPDY